MEGSAYCEKGTGHVWAMTPPPTARLFFRTWRLEDWPLAMALWGDPRVSALIGGPFSEKSVRERLETELQRQERHAIQYWPLFRKADGQHVGCCGVRPHDSSAGTLEVGFQLRPEHWGLGFATESARAVVDYAFDHLGARGLVAGHHPKNSSSQRVLEKLGFRYTHDELYPPTGLQHRSYLLTADLRPGT